MQQSRALNRPPSAWQQKFSDRDRRQELMKVPQAFQRFVDVFGDGMFKGRSRRVGRICAAYLFFLVALIPGSTSVGNVTKTITALVTETVILPCRITVDGELPTLEWSKEGLSPPNITFLYRDGCETFGMKNPALLYRTNLVLNELKDGNISQIIYNLRPSDGGVYQCRTFRGGQWEVHAVLVLNVGAASEPKLTVVPSTSGVTLECTAQCWFPEPEITLLDDGGNEIKAGNPTRVSAPECFTVTVRADVQTPTNRVTCRVHEALLNQTRNTEIFIPDHWMQFCSNVAITTGFTVFILTGLIACGITYLLHRKFCGMRPDPCLSRCEDQRSTASPEKDHMNPKSSHMKSEKERPKSNSSGTSQQDQSRRDCRASLNDTEQETQHSSYNRSTGPATSKMKDTGVAVSRQDKVPSPQKKDRPENNPASPPKEPTRLSVPSFHRSLSHRSNASEESELLIEKP
ncbi:butyrophilin subfamily 2 member A2-like [Fundulus diaphanus]